MESLLSMISSIIQPEETRTVYTVACQHERFSDALPNPILGFALLHIQGGFLPPIMYVYLQYTYLVNNVYHLYCYLEVK